MKYLSYVYIIFAIMYRENNYFSNASIYFAGLSRDHGNSCALHQRNLKFLREIDHSSYLLLVKQNKYSPLSGQRALGRFNIST